MEGKDLEVGTIYQTTDPIKACLYGMETQDCEFADMVDLPSGTEVTYIVPDDDDGGFIFQAEDGNTYCLHTDDLASIEEA